MAEKQGAINIGDREQARRRVFGIIMYLTSALIGGVFFQVGLKRWWRLGLFLPLLLGGYGVFQAREKT